MKVRHTVILCLDFVERIRDMQAVTISNIKAREILDSRGMPTVETTVYLSDGSQGSASVPSGASRGSHEAHELRDGEGDRYGGKGVREAVRLVEEKIADLLRGRDAYDQSAADHIMITLDGTKNKSNLGANSILSVSLALANAAAESLKLPLYRYLGGTAARRIPVPMMNILNGGAHASNNVDIQEFMIVPHGFQTVEEGVRAGSEVYFALKDILSSRGLSTAVGDEGGFAPDLSGDEEALDLLVLAIRRAGYETAQIGLAIDAAANEWVKGEAYCLPKRGGEFSPKELIARWEDYATRYPLLSIEDGLGEDDFSSWSELTDLIGDQMLLVGDDLFVTNAKRLSEGASKGSANAILVKPNQIGTLTEVLDVIALATRYGYRHILSHRSGDTVDTTISDIAVATCAPLIKTGAPARGERVAKYNRLMKISAELGGHSRYGF